MKKEKYLKGLVRKGQKLCNVMYKSENLIVHTAKKGNGKHFVVLGSGYSMSVDENNRITEHDPVMMWPDVSQFSENTTVMSIFYPFECKGLEEAGKEICDYFNEFEFEELIFIGHSKCGVCFANMAKWLENERVIITISAPFYGTPIANLDFQMKLNWFARWIYSKIFSNHKVDQDICPGSEFLARADFSGLNKFPHNNIVSTVGSKITLNPITLFLRYMDKKGIHGDGIVPRDSQELPFANVILDIIEATHAESLKKGIEIVKGHLSTL